MTKFLDKLKTLSIGISHNISDKVEAQRREYGADLVQPHVYDKSKRKLVINPDFVKLYPDKLRYYETPENIRKAGYAKLASDTEKLNKASKQIRQQDIEYVGEERKAIKKVVK